MRLTLIALLLAGVVGCDSDRRTRPPQPPVEEPKPEAENGGDDGSESEFEAILKAAEQGDAEAQRNLGEMFRDGEGVPEDDVEAVKWYRKAAEQGEARAQYKLGWMYIFGRGVPQDYAEALKWYRKAAEQGLADAQWVLGVMYSGSEGVPQDDVEAYAWFSVAATNGYEDAEKDLPIAKAKLTPEQLTEGQQRATTLFKQINANKAK